MLTRILCCAALLGALPASAAVLWRGDFETGDLGQWSRVEEAAANRLQVVDTPLREGGFALRAEVRQGDDPIGASGNRNELAYYGDTPEGEERWYKWSTRFAPSFPSTDEWQIVTQWHHRGSSGSPPLLFNVRSDVLMLMATEPGGDPRPVWSTPLVRDAWHDFILHVKWSPDPAQGFVELWYDGVQATPLTHLPTLYAGQSNYLKQGLYRSSAVSQTGVVFHDGFVEATAPEDVFPPPAAAEAEPQAEPEAGDGTGDGTGAGPGAGGGGCATGGRAGAVALLAPAAFAAVRRARRRKTGRTGRRS